MQSMVTQIYDDFTQKVADGRRITQAQVDSIGQGGPAEADAGRLWVLAAVIGLEALGVGLGTTAFVAYMARTTHPAYTATQLALFTSLMAVPRTFINASAGWLVEYFGWFDFFLLCGVLAVPGMLLLFKVAPWRETPAAVT